jgi:cell division protein FtsL
MSTVAETARLGRSRPRTRSATRARTRPRLLGGGVLWIVAFGALLTGVVAVNVAVLRLNLELDRVGNERSELKADVARLRSELSSTAATSQIVRTATRELGLERADPDTTVFVRLPAK